jgi:hypothetical protein
LEILDADEGKRGKYEEAEKFQLNVGADKQETRGKR